jgi:drug/metabolite transporter (DMT)-like permease
MKIFGREPTAYLALIGAVVYIMTGLGFNWFTDNDAGVVLPFIAAVLGVINVITVRPWQVPAIKLVATTGFALLAQYGIHLNDKITGGILLLIVTGLALPVRNQATPASDPTVGGGVTKANVPDARVPSVPAPV